jgi:hypothetical protein
MDWLEDADFTNDFNIKQICTAEFESDDFERTLTVAQVVHLVKVLAYKIGISFKR